MTDLTRRWPLAARLILYGLLALAFVLIVATARAVPENWSRIYGYVLVHEGGARYTNHPNDPGGPTKYGITIYDVRLYIKKNATAADVRALTEAQAKWIYENKYWQHKCVRGPDLPSGLDYSNMDYGVNSGVGRSGKLLRELLGFSTATCTLTDEVIAKVKALSEPELIRLVARYNDRRLAFLKRLRTWPVFGRGWGRRVASVKKNSMHMAGAVTHGFMSGPPPAPAFGPHKAIVSAADLMPDMPEGEN